MFIWCRLKVRYGSNETCVRNHIGSPGHSITDKRQINGIKPSSHIYNNYISMAIYTVEKQKGFKEIIHTKKIACTKHTTCVSDLINKT